MRDGKPSALELLQRTEGHVTDEILEQLGQEQFPETLPAQEVISPEPSSPQAASPDPEDSVSKADFLRYHALRERNPERFERVRQKMVAWTEDHPQDFKKWDSSHREFLAAYDEFNRELIRQEHRARFGEDIKFKDELEAEAAAEEARSSAEAMARAEAEEEVRLKALLKEARASADRNAEDAILHRLADKVLGNRPLIDPKPAVKRVEKSPPERKLSIFELKRNEHY